MSPHSGDHLTLECHLTADCHLAVESHLIVECHLTVECCLTEDASARSVNNECVNPVSSLHAADLSRGKIQESGRHLKLLNLSYQASNLLTELLGNVMVSEVGTPEKEASLG